MLIFIDDSGDPGFKVDRGSTPALVIALVCFVDNLEAEKTATVIKELKKVLGLQDSMEFKFSKTKNEFKTAFLEAVKDLEFKVRAVVFQKENIYSPNLINNKDRFYKFAIKTALDASKHLLTNANIKIDGHEDKNFRREFETYLRRELKNDQGETLYQKLSFVKNSSNNLLIQLADMCAGSINRNFSTKGQDKQFQDIIQQRIENIWDFK